MSFFDLGVQQEKSYLGVLRHTVLTGPLTLVRFSASAAQESGAYGKYWMYGSEIVEAIGKTQQHLLIREIRQRWAVSNDWSDLKNYFILRLPEGKQLNAYWGFAKFQPRHSKMATKRSSYSGGSIQLVLSIGPEERKLISGPFSTLSLHKSSIPA